VIHETVRRRFRAANLSLEQRIERPLNVAGSKRTPIVKGYAAMEVKNVSQRIRNLPMLRQPGLNIQVLVARQQRVEKELANALRLRINPHPRIEIRWAAFNDHDQRVGLGSLRAGEERQHPSANESQKNCHPKQNCHPERSEGPAFCACPHSRLTHTISFPGSPPASLP